MRSDLWINLISDSCSCKQENPNNLDFLNSKKVWLKGMQPLCACSQRSLCPSSQVSILTTSPLIKKASGYLEFQKLPLSKRGKGETFLLCHHPTTTTWNYEISCFMEDVNTTQRFSFPFSELTYIPLEFNSRKTRQHLTN